MTTKGCGWYNGGHLDLKIITTVEYDTGKYITSSLPGIGVCVAHGMRNNSQSNERVMLPTCMNSGTVIFVSYAV